MAPLEFVVFSREDRPALRTCVGAVVPVEIRSGRETLLLVHIPYGAGPNGLPAQGELRRVGELEDRVTVALAPHDALFIGHVNSEGQSTIAYCAPRPAPATVKVKTGLFKSIELPVESRFDAGWTWFDRKLAPTVEEEEAGRNQALHEALARQGDVAAKPREVDFTFFFRADSDRAAFLELVAPEGYLPNGEGLWATDPPDAALGVTLMRSVSIEPSEMARRCARLREQAKRHGGVFDGWGCPIAT